MDTFTELNWRELVAKSGKVQLAVYWRDKHMIKAPQPESYSLSPISHGSGDGRSRTHYG